MSERRICCRCDQCNRGFARRLPGAGTVSGRDRLWTVPNTLVASANCGRYCGADVDLVDIDPSTWNLSVPQLREKLKQAQKDGLLPNVLRWPHLYGQLDPILQLDFKHGV